MGFAKRKCQDVLEDAAGDLETAIELLFSNCVR